MARARTPMVNNPTKIIAVFILNIYLVTSEPNGYSLLENFRGLGRSYLNQVYNNGTFDTGNKLWDGILNQCTIKPSVECLQKNVYSYLDDRLNFSGDIKVSDGLSFKKNKVDVGKYTKEANMIYLIGSKDEDKKDFEERSLQDDEENEVDSDFSETPLEEVTDAVYDRGINFLVTHDMKLQLPEIFFHGATLKISPRALTKTGALVHVELEPKRAESEGRIFFKKIKKYIRKKLVMAAIAIILVIKLIALKVFFVFPVIFGVTTAKKVFLKLLLFLFPALSHIFKLCSWYHQNYHTTKFHHHHHLITHHHHKMPHASHHGPIPAPVYGPPSHHGGHTSVITPHHESGPTFEHYPQDWELSGPGLGNEYIASDIHRNAINNFKPHVDDANDINSWGLGLPPGQSANVGEISSPAVNQPVSSPSNTKLTYAPGRPVGPPGNPYHRLKKLTPKDPLQAEKEALIRAAALAARAPPSPVRDELLRVSAAKLSENRQKHEESLKQHSYGGDPDTIAAEQFYSALIARVDNVLSPLGANDIGCLERSICSLYKDPINHAPYSNLVSNELSKDSNELLPAAGSEMAYRYYRYVQAARDGQEQKDCLSLYSECNIDFS